MKTHACQCFLLFVCLSGIGGCQVSLEQQVIGADKLMVVFYTPQRDTILISEKEYINHFSSEYLTTKPMAQPPALCPTEGTLIFWRKGKIKVQVEFSATCKFYAWQGRSGFYHLTELGVDFLTTARQIRRPVINASE